MIVQTFQMNMYILIFGEFVQIKENQHMGIFGVIPNYRKLFKRRLSVSFYYVKKIKEEKLLWQFE